MKRKFMYPVHDNLITTAPYAKYISDTYIMIFAEGREPLYYNNDFLQLNLGNGQSSYSIDKPLPLDYLSNIWKNRVPLNLNQNQKKVWDKKIKSLIDAYDYYVNLISKSISCKENPIY